MHAYKTCKCTCGPMPTLTQCACVTSTFSQGCTAKASSTTSTDAAAIVASSHQSKLVGIYYFRLNNDVEMRLAN